MKHHHPQASEPQRADAASDWLAGLTAEERVAGLSTDEIVAVLPAEVLRALSEDYVRTLPPEVQDVVRTRVDALHGR